MNTRTKTGFQILQVALCIGVLGDVLLRALPWGLNVFLFNLAFVAGVFMLMKRRAPERLSVQAISLMGAQLFFAAMFVWRDSAELKTFDTFAIIAILAVLFVPKLSITAKVAGVFQYGIALFWSGLSAAFAPAVLLGSDIDWKIPDSGWRKTAVAVLRGLALVTPLILIFGGLFVAADAAYQGLVQRVFNFDPQTLFSHALLFTIFTWLSAGYLRGILISGLSGPIEAIVNQTATPSVVPTEESKFAKVRAESGEHPVTLPGDRPVVDHLNAPDAPEQKADAGGSEGDAKARASARAEHGPQNEETASGEKWSWANIDNALLPKAFTLGAIEVGIILGLMNLLFLSFVIVQVPYLFGGMELVQNTPDFKLAEYARRGFGELVAVSAFLLPTLLIGHWLIRKSDKLASTMFRILAGTQIILLFVIMASAVQRLVLLTGNLGYGMTTVRLYPLIFMTWLAIVFVWFGATVLRNARQYFAWGALWSALFVLGITHFLNPDAFIVKTNLALMREGREFDASYNSSLSADALPTLIEAIPLMNLDQQCESKRFLHYQYRDLGQSNDLRSLNYSRKRAWHILHENDSSLHSVEGCPAWIVSELGEQ